MQPTDVSTGSPTSAACALLAWVSFSAAIVAPPTIGAAQHAEGRRGKDLHRRLDTPLSLAWTNNPLRQALGDLSRSQGLAIMLDRRVDPGQRVTFSVTGVTLQAALQRLAERLQAGVCYVGEVAYIGPEPVTRRLATLAALKSEEMQKLWKGLGRSLPPERPSWWADLAAPQELVQELASQADVRIENPSQIPHDLWPAAELPPLGLAERLTLVLAGFDLSFALAPDGSAIRLIPMPADVSIERTLHRSLTEPEVAKLAAKFPDVRIRRQDDRVVAAGRLEELEQIEQEFNAMKGSTSTRRVERRTDQRGAVYTLTVKDAQAGAILKTLAAKAGWELRIDPSAAPRLHELVSLQLQNATMEQLLARTLHPLGLTFRVRGDTLEIAAARD